MWLIKGTVTLWDEPPYRNYFTFLMDQLSSIEKLSFAHFYWYMQLKTCDFLIKTSHFPHRPKKERKNIHTHICSKLKWSQILWHSFHREVKSTSPPFGPCGLCDSVNQQNTVQETCASFRPRPKRLTVTTSHLSKHLLLEPWADRKEVQLPKQTLYGKRGPAEPSLLTAPTKVTGIWMKLPWMFQTNQPPTEEHHPLTSVNTTWSIRTAQTNPIQIPDPKSEICSMIKWLLF